VVVTGADAVVFGTELGVVVVVAGVDVVVVVAGV